MKLTTKDPALFSPVYTFTQGFNSSGGAFDYVSVRDCLFYKETATTNYWIAVDQGYAHSDTVENLNPEVADITDWPRIDYVSNGQFRVRITNAAGVANTYTLIMSDSADYTLRPQEFKAGTFGKYTWDILQPLLDAPGKSEVY